MTVNQLMWLSNFLNEEYPPTLQYVMLSDRRYPCFRNFNSVVSIDVIRMKSYVDSLFDPACVSVGVTIDKLDLIP